MRPGTCCCSASAMFSESVRAICAAPTALIAGRHLVDIDAHAGDRRRRGRVDKNAAYVPGGGGSPGCIPAAGAAHRFGGWRRRNDLDGGQYLVASWCRRGLGLRSVISGNETQRCCPNKQESSAHCVSSPFPTGTLVPAGRLRMILGRQSGRAPFKTSRTQAGKIPELSNARRSGPRLPQLRHYLRKQS